MAYFRGTVQGNRGEASRSSSKDSGLLATANGWNLGGSAHIYHDPARNIDIVRLRVTGGSNSPGTKLIHEYAIIDDKLVNLKATK